LTLQVLRKSFCRNALLTFIMATYEKHAQICAEFSENIRKNDLKNIYMHAVVALSRMG